jgi:hypothetical protein
MRRFFSKKAIVEDKVFSAGFDVALQDSQLQITTK